VRGETEHSVEIFFSREFTPYGIRQDDIVRPDVPRKESVKPHVGNGREGTGQ
jgi:hypothetical protein